MANGIFNIALGNEKGYHDRVANNDPANSALVIVLLQVAETDSILQDYADLSTLLGAAGNTEATFTNYARKVLTDADIAAGVVSNTTNDVVLDFANPEWASAGLTVDNTLVKLLICVDLDTTTGTDSNIIPISYHDFSATTNGEALSGVIGASGYINIANA